MYAKNKTDLMTLEDLTIKLTPDIPLKYYHISHFDRQFSILTVTKISYKRFPEFQGGASVSEIRRYKVDLNIKDEVITYKEI